MPSIFKGTDVDWDAAERILVACADEAPERARALGESLIAAVDRQRYETAATKRFAEMSGGVMGR